MSNTLASQFSNSKQFGVDKFNEVSQKINFSGVNT
jgi:hypothetical protein